ncbi:MAG: transposase [Salibacteraceae bacterium]
MQFENDHLYHVYNQGNNRQKIFFDRANYLFFIEKLRTYVLPYADIYAWCLMPNHFHLMIYVKSTDSESEGFTLSETLTRKRTLNESIGIMLRSYTRAINKSNNTSGSLFRKETKAECLDCPKGLTPSFYTKTGATQINLNDPEKNYPQICFNYIHANPTKAGLVKNDWDWEYSSAADYVGKRNGTLIDKEQALKKIGIS